MSYINPASLAGVSWRVFEAARRGTGCCTAEWAELPAAELAIVFRHLRLLEAAGHPPDREKLQRVSLAVGRCRLADRRVLAIHELKSKPTHWRTYYIADPATRHCYLLHTVAKKTQRADPDDIRRACAVATGLLRGDYVAQRIDLPAP